MRGGEEEFTTKGGKSTMGHVLFVENRSGGERSLLKQAVPRLPIQHRFSREEAGATRGR